MDTLGQPLPASAASPPVPSRAHLRRLRDIWRSAGWPCQDAVEIELLAAGLLERVRALSGHETLRVSDAGVALLLLALHRYGAGPGTAIHPFFQEGRRIVRTARFHPAPDKLLALQDLALLYAALNRTIEASELQEDVQHMLQQMSWQPHFVAVDPEVDGTFPNPAAASKSA